MANSKGPMNQSDKFVTDFFRLGANGWVDAYWNISVPVSVDQFVERICELGLELQFVDQPRWTANQADSLPCYLIHEAPLHRYAIYSVDRGIPRLEKSFSTLKEGMRFKAEELFETLAMVRRLRTTSSS